MPSTGQVVVWACFCSDAADDPATLPESCPGHGMPRVCDPVENFNEGPTLGGHSCNGVVNPCQ